MRARNPAAGSAGFATSRHAQRSPHARSFPPAPFSARPRPAATTLVQSRRLAACDSSVLAPGIAERPGYFAPRQAFPGAEVQLLDLRRERQRAAVAFGECSCEYRAALRWAGENFICARYVRERCGDAGGCVVSQRQVEMAIAGPLSCRGRRVPDQNDLHAARKPR